MTRSTTTSFTASLLAATFLFGTAAMASDVLPPAGPYVGVGLGIDSITPGHSMVDNSPARIKFKDGWVALINGGYKWESGFRTELELSHRHSNAKDVNANTIPLTGSLRDTALMANVLFEIPTGSRFTPYLGGGVGLSFLELKQLGMPTGTTRFDGNSSKFAWQGIIGAAYSFTPQLALTVEARYKASNNHTFSSNRTERVTDYDHRARDILIGLRYSFGAPAKAEPAPAPAAAPAPIATPQRAPAPPVPQKFLVFFDFDKSNLRADAKKIVSEAAAYSKTNGKATITATGHADTSGSAAYNMGLSERRADAVQAELERLGIPKSEISVHWKGESEPLVQTGDGVKEPQNRRVEIILE